MANAIINWNGSVSGDWTTGANWSTGSQPSTSGDNDWVKILHDAANAPSLNLDRTADDTNNGLVLNVLEVEPGYSMNVGSTGTPLICAANQIIHRGAGAVYFKAGEGSATPGNVVGQIIVESPNQQLAFQMDSGSNVINVNRWYGWGGAASIASTFTGTIAYGVLEGRTGRAKLTLDAANSDLFTVIDVRTNAELIANRGIGTLHLNGGITRFGSDESTEQLDKGYLNAGTLFYELDGGTITELHQSSAAELDLTKCSQCTITDFYGAYKKPVGFNPKFHIITNDWRV